MKKEQIKHDKESNWQKASFIPKKDEVIIYDADEEHELPRIKVGNGRDNINELPFSGEKNFEVEDGLLSIL